MIVNYLRQILRGIRSKKTYFLLNLLGLTTGITAFVLIVLWVKTETSFDQFHENAQNIYRVDYKLYEEEVLELYSAAAVPVIGPLLQETYPEVEQYTRFSRTEGVIKYNNLFFKEKQLFFAESSFFSLFNFQLAAGNLNDDLLAVNKAVISERAAKKYFNNEDPIGKVITLNGNDKYSISAVAKNVPENSHIKFDILLSYENLINRNSFFDNGWFGPSFQTYVRLAPGTDFKATERKIPDLVEENLGDFMKRAFFLAEFKLRPLLDIHLNSNLKNELGVNGNRSHVQFMSIIALLVLVIAFINYINMATARSAERASEVGVRKVMGAIRKHLLAQFLSESVIVNATAIILSLGLVIILLPIFSDFTGSPVSIPWGTLPIILIVIFLISSFSTGIIPATYLSRLSPSLILRGKGSSRSQKVSRLRNGLVVFQFAISVILIVGTIVIGKQLSFLQKQNIGIDIDQMLVVEGPKAVNNETYTNSLDAFRSEMVQLAHVKQMTVSTSVPGEEITIQPVYGKLVDGLNTEKKIDMIGIDQHFMDTYGLKLIAGRNFDKNYTQDIREVILNESALPYLGFSSAKEAIGKRLTGSPGEADIIGVVNDYNQQSLRQKPYPMIFCNRPNNSWYSIKVNASQADLVISKLENLWGQKFPGNPLKYFFLDEHFNEQYRADKKIGSLFMLFSVLAIFIACLGLLGLSAYATAQRTREIGVRKVNGAKVGEVLLILNKDFIKWVAMAFVIAVPVAWYAMNKWLGGFAYKTALSWWIFALSGILALGIALLTVSWQSWKAATRNPVEALRYE
ncbi:ABC transporter permease [Sunxiuqinia sp. A32]|uniref:ABC transporter permease n=1 Tax=Sunxiuqinia sp. A32 TaxID=3461496 RepID=UPI004045F762